MFWCLLLLIVDIGDKYEMNFVWICDIGVCVWCCVVCIFVVFVVGVFGYCDLC